MNLKTVDWIALASFIASGGLATLAQVLSQIYPGQATTILNILAIVTALAGVLTRLFTNKTGAPATSIVNDAPVVSKDGSLGYGTNVSTTSTTPIAAPAPLKGPPLS